MEDTVGFLTVLVKGLILIISQLFLLPIKCGSLTWISNSHFIRQSFYYGSCQVGIAIFALGGNLKINNFFHVLDGILPLGSGSSDPHNFSDPDPRSQNLADPTDLDLKPKHWTLSSGQLF